MSDRAEIRDRLALPGDWIAVANEDLTLLLPATERSRAVGLWPLVDDGAGAEQVLDALISGGVSALCPFVLVDLTGSGTRVLVRGEPTVRANAATGEVEVAAGHRIWADEQLERVERITVELGAEGTEEFLLRPGLCRVGAVGWGTDRAEPAVEAAVEAAVVPTPAPTPEPEVRPAPASDDGGLPPVVRPIVKRPEPPAPAPPTITPPTITPPVVAPPVVAPSVPPVPPSLPVEETTRVERKVDPELETAPIATSAPDQQWQEDVTTHLPADDLQARLEDDRLEDDQFAGDVEEDIIPFPRPAPVAVGRLVFSHGLTVDVADRPLVVGRAPSVPRGHRGGTPELITVPSPLQEVSSTHVEFRAGTGIDHGSVVVTDLGSTNGTVVVEPGGPTEDLRPGMPVAVRPGAAVDLGDGVQVRVTEP